MINQPVVLLVLACLFIRIVQSNVVLNLTNTEKLLCYSCKGSNCESITNDEDNIILCNKFTQLCWAGFLDQQPYRTCASRYCTPSGISLDSDVRIESCCHSDLCNTVSLSWPLNSRWYRKSFASRTSSSTPRPVPVTTESTTTPALKPNAQRPQAYVVNEIVDDDKDLFDSGEAQEPSRLSRLQLNASDPASFGINWQRVPYDTDFSIPVASISKLLVLLMPILLVLLF